VYLCPSDGGTPCQPGQPMKGGCAFGSPHCSWSFLAVPSNNPRTCTPHHVQLPRTAPPLGIDILPLSLSSETHNEHFDTFTLHRHNTTTLQHYNTTTLQHDNTTTLQHSMDTTYCPSHPLLPYPLPFEKYISNTPTLISKPIPN
jgi:hypothetical protein